MCKTKLGLGQYQETIIVWKRKKEDKFQVHWIYLLGLFDTTFDKKVYRATISFIPKSISSTIHRYHYYLNMNQTRGMINMCCHAKYALTCCFLEQKTLLYQPIYSYYCSTYLFLASISLLFEYKKENIVYFIVSVITFYSSIRHTLQNCLELFHKSIQNWIRTADGVWLVFHINMHYARTVSFFVHILTDIITDMNV